MHAGAHDALHSKRCARCNHPVTNVSADEMAAVDATDYGGARVAVPAAAARHVHSSGRQPHRTGFTHESSLASY